MEKIQSYIQDGTIANEVQPIESEKNTQADTFYIHVLAKDRAENKKEIVSEPITIKTGYAISTPEDLQNIKNNLSASYYVINDINMENFNFTTIDGYFAGQINGQGYTISNLKIEGSEYVGIFKNIRGRNVRISNLLMKNVNISATGNRVGIFAGQVYPGGGEIIFEKVGVTGRVRSGGGLIAAFVGISMLDYDYERMSFQDCYARVDLETGTQYDVAALTTTSARNSGKYLAKNCYWSGTSNGTHRTSSLISYTTTANNSNQATSNNITVQNSYYNKQKFPLNIIQTTSGTGLTTEEMGRQENYIGWDFGSTWYMGEDGYPELKFEN